MDLGVELQRYEYTMSGEVLTGTIEVHNLISSTGNGNNVSDRFHFQPHGSMVGAITGGGVARWAAGRHLFRYGLPATWEWHRRRPRPHNRHAARFP